MPAVGRHERRRVEIRLFARVIRRSVNRRLIDQPDRLHLERIRVMIVRHHAIHHEIDERYMRTVKERRFRVPGQRQREILKSVGDVQVINHFVPPNVHDFRLDLRRLSGTQTGRPAKSENKIRGHR